MKATLITADLKFEPFEEYITKVIEDECRWTSPRQIDLKTLKTNFKRRVEAETSPGMIFTEEDWSGGEALLVATIEVLDMHGIWEGSEIGEGSWPAALKWGISCPASDHLVGYHMDFGRTYHPAPAGMDIRILLRIIF